MKLLSGAVVYGSLLFVLVFLYRFDYLTVPEIDDPVLLALSVLVIVMGLTLEALAWRRMLEAESITITGAECIAASGGSVLGKYIPGKVWLIVGRAAFVAEARGLPLAPLSVITLNAQVLSLFVGLLLGALGLAAVGGLARYGPAALIACVVFSVVLFDRRLRRAIEGSLGRRWPGFAGRLPRVAPAVALNVSPLLAACWASLALGFHWMVVSLGTSPASLTVGLGFPLAAVLGMVAVFAPGGLGVREGILAGFLILAGLDASVSATLAVASRLWFLAGELLFFSLGLAARRLTTRR